MLQTIQNALKECGVSAWRVRRTVEETSELFFVRKQLDTRRIKDTEKYDVTVFRKETRDGKDLCGETAITLTPGMSPEKIREEIAGACFSAQFALNPDYLLPDPVSAPIIRKTGFLAEHPLRETADIMTKAMFEADDASDAWLNSAEIFVVRKECRILSSEGTDVSWTEGTVKGEYVVQCKEPEDVEMHHKFEYDECRPDALKKAVSEALVFVRDRAVAQKVLKTGDYDLILTGESLEEILSYYGARSHASMIFPHYSDWKAGDDVQEAEDGDPIDLTLASSAPYSPEGIRMNDFPLIRAGKLEGIHGETRFCRYLGIRPTGRFNKAVCGNPGSLSFANMKKKPCLWAVSFSDFQMDVFSGHFGGEIRLAYLIENGKATPVTGGSVNGSLLEAQKHIRFSTDRYVSAEYEGPYAAILPSVAVAGAGDDE